MKNKLRNICAFYLDEVKANKFYIQIILMFLMLSYTIYIFFSVDTISQMGEEDSLFENLTSFFFLMSSVFFLRSYFIHKNFFFLLMTIVMFMGFGEEISWGQRMFNIKTPNFMTEINVQNEITLHNIEIFHGRNFDEEYEKTGLARLITINFLYKLFWLVYGILLPIAFINIKFVSYVVEKLNLPIPPLSIGLLFFINWLTFRLIRSFFLPLDEPFQYYDTIGEIRECCSSFIFMIISFYFLKSKNLGIHYDRSKKTIPI